MLTRRLGKFPTSREIEVARRADPKLPTPRAFRRLGGKAELVRSVLAFCSGRPEFDDITAHCHATVGVEDSDAIEDSHKVGEVYLYKVGRYYKIGKTKDTVRRGAEIRLQLPEKPLLVHLIKTDDPSGVELYWHRRFGAKRVNGEWFGLDQSDVRAFKRWRRIL